MSKIPRHIRVAERPTQFEGNSAWGLEETHRQPISVVASLPIPSNRLRFKSMISVHELPRQVAETDLKKDESTRHHFAIVFIVVVCWSCAFFQRLIIVCLLFIVSVIVVVVSNASRQSLCIKCDAICPPFTNSGPPLAMFYDRRAINDATLHPDIANPSQPKIHSVNHFTKLFQ